MTDELIERFNRAYAKAQKLDMLRKARHKGRPARPQLTVGDLYHEEHGPAKKEHKTLHYATSRNGRSYELIWRKI
ncbi:hypothetical protein GWN63_06415 [Candidatus Bathyarchaeota archaeon]|nr:hypothetical protein [Candidatus Bathyarchaeota archaeon]NIR14448.1 hypothetical protein [Desulfobacterales bacterium]NIU81852.1 hypothetical protein [Candidatus Bathyarchaeota archaeon]NIV68486.1 hypothetical protein [Candidatus Bathyarchaeota archaeon]NIW34991.1 hypothetical protein [Candidatus Bathyarchaeota archaeon]